MGKPEGRPGKEVETINISYIKTTLSQFNSYLRQLLAALGLLLQLLHVLVVPQRVPLPLLLLPPPLPARPCRV